jgi:septal ring factor EnvC (AmiA/AmiB activator)
VKCLEIQDYQRQYAAANKALQEASESTKMTKLQLDQTLVELKLKEEETTTFRRDCEVLQKDLDQANARLEENEQMLRQQSGIPPLVISLKLLRTSRTLRS